ncbi:PRC-barrel domain-containing protein [Phenylobacterium sp. LjRoot225]|uniref:PRC-barrel domain-containing protein n=1 Tax=Phenylobacterium sp. LjRoot225 TaxID=3342285 RepID=UPI003ED10417
MKRIIVAAIAAAFAVPCVAVAQSAALGLTRHQLEDADLVDAQGREIGEVEKLVVGPNGNVTGLIVEIDQRDPTPDRRVQIPLTGLKSVPERGDPGDHNIQTQRSVAELLALPASSG